MGVKDTKRDPSQQAVYCRRPLCPLRPVPWASKMNFPLRTRRGHDTALSSPLLERLGILKHRGSCDVRVWLNCTGLLDGLTIHEQHYKSKASCPSYWLQKTPEGGFQSIKYYMHSYEKDAAEEKGYCHLPSSESDSEKLEKPIGRPKTWSQSTVW